MFWLRSHWLGVQGSRGGGLGWGGRSASWPQQDDYQHPAVEAKQREDAQIAFQHASFIKMQMRRRRNCLAPLAAVGGALISLPMPPAVLGGTLTRVNPPLFHPVTQ